MTKIESRNAIEVDELPPWDDTDAPNHDDAQFGPADEPALTPYGFDSQQRTLVGIGPLERARRSRPAAPAPDSQRLPQSEPPGPFIADDDDEFPAPRPQRKLGKRALALSSALLVPLAAVGLVRRLSPPEQVPSKPARIAVAQVAPTANRASETPSRTDLAAEDERKEAPPTEVPPAADADDAGAPERTKGHLKSTPTAQRAPSEAAPPTVRLADLPATPALVDRSNGDVRAGTINVASTPPSNVVLDGRPLGKSPRVVRVSPGPHTVVFIHPLYGRRSLNVTVGSGATTGASAEF